jgi:hypothetical protein
MTKTKENIPRRVQLLLDGINLTSGDRDKEYGTPYTNLTDCGMLFSAYLMGKYNGRILMLDEFMITAEDVAWLNVLQKIARTFNGHVKPDTYTDAAAYAAIAGECAEMEKAP